MFNSNVQPYCMEAANPNYRKTSTNEYLINDMNHLGLTVFAGNIPGIVLDFDKESKEYTIEFTDGRVVKTAVVNWDTSIPADPEVAKYRLANNSKEESLVFDSEGWDIVTNVVESRDYWETGAPHEISKGEDYDDDHMRSDIGGNSVMRHVEKELFNNRKDEEGNPEMDFVDDADEIVQFPPVPHDVESFLERAESAEPDPMKTDREFPSGEYKERSRIPQHSHVREQAAWEDAHYAKNPVCEDCGDPLVNEHCYSCLDKKKGISPEEYGIEEQETTIRQAATKTAFLPALGAIAAPLLARLGIGAAAGAVGGGEAAAVGGGSMLGNIGRMAGRAMAGQAMTAPFVGEDSASGAQTVPAEDMSAGSDYQSIALAATEPSEGIFAVEIHGVDSHPENGGTGNYNAQHGDGPEYLKDVNDIGGPLSAIRRFTEEDNIDGALEEALSVIADGLPVIIEFADSDESASDNESVKAFDELFEAVFGEDYTKARDEEKGGKKESRVAADQQDTVVCRKCNRTAIVGQRACSNVPALPDCPIVSVERIQAYPAGAQNPQQQAPSAPTSTVPQTLNFPTYPRITKTLKVAARKPKMCPYHADLVDYSVALKDPAAALGALSQHQYSQNSCKGGWGEAEGTKCRFKPEMIHNEYWEEKEREAEERKQQREMQKAEEAARLEEENLLDPIIETVPVEEEVQEEIAAPAESPIDPEYETVPDMTNVSEDSGSSYNDYIAPENYSYDSAIDNGSYEREPVMAANREWIMKDAAEDDEVRVYEYPGEDNYDEGSADGSRIEDSDGNELEEGEIYRIGPEGELPDVVEVVSIDPQYIEVRRIDSSFPEDMNNRPYRLTLKEIMVQDISIEKVDGQLNPAEVGRDSVDALAGTPETNDDAGPGHNDIPGTSDLSSGRKANAEHYSASEVKDFMKWLQNNGFTVVAGGSGHNKVYYGNTLLGSFSATPSDPRSLINAQKQIARNLRILQQQQSGEDVEIPSRRASEKIAGQDYSISEQKQFINENGTARNLDKLDLSGTHYPEEMSDSDDDYFLWG